MVASARPCTPVPPGNLHGKEVVITPNLCDARGVLLPNLAQLDHNVDHAPIGDVLVRTGSAQPKAWAVTGSSRRPPACKAN
jgi:hypothetical protein